MKRKLTLGIVSALAVTACLGAGDVGARGEEATASKANCQGTAFSPVQRQNKLISKGTLECTGDVARSRLQVCLEQRTRRGYQRVECNTGFRLRPGKFTVRVEHACKRGPDREFRTRAFLFLKDLNGQRAHGKAISPTPVFPRDC